MNVFLSLIIFLIAERLYNHSRGTRKAEPKVRMVEHR